MDYKNSVYMCSVCWTLDHNSVLVIFSIVIKSLIVNCLRPDPGNRGVP